MESLLEGISGEVVYIDFILVTGSSDEEHLDHLDHLTLPEWSGTQAQEGKYVFLAKSVQYLEYYVIDVEGLHPMAEKVKSVQEEAPNPTNVTESKVTWVYYPIIPSSFLPCLLFWLHYNVLLRNKESWHWGKK